MPPKPPVLEPGHDYGSVTDKISSIVLTRPITKGWFLGFIIAFTLLKLVAEVILPDEGKVSVRSGVAPLIER